MKIPFNKFYAAIFSLTLALSACSNDKEEEEDTTEVLITTDGFTTPDTDTALPETSFGNEAGCDQTEDDKFNAEFLVLINKYRESIGANKFSSNTIANYLAFKHTKYMICTGDFGHTNFDEIGNILGKTVKSTAAAENVIMGYDTPQKMLDGWLSSPPHKGNIDNPAYTHTGFSTIKDSNGRYWATQNFYK